MRIVQNERLKFEIDSESVLRNSTLQETWRFQDIMMALCLLRSNLVHVMAQGSFRRFKIGSFSVAGGVFALRVKI